MEGISTDNVLAFRLPLSGSLPTVVILGLDPRIHR